MKQSGSFSLPKLLVVCAVLALFLASPSAPAQTWSVVWSDEFDGAANSPIDRTKWKFETGNNNGWGNQELEVYCDPASSTPAPCDVNNPNAFIDGNGNLVIRAIRINSNIAVGSWTSTRMNTGNGQNNFQYGRIEARMQLPTGPGLWPAFWALGSNIGSVGWPNCGESDYMENVPASAGLGPSKIRSTLHGPGYSGANGLGQDYSFPSGTDVTSFHIYGAIWSPNMVQFYVDAPSNVFFIRTAADVPGGSSQWAFNHSFFLLLDLAVGGNYPGSPDSTTCAAAPCQMLVDYVRVYKAAGVPSPNLGTPPAISIKAGATTGNTSTLTIGEPSGSGRIYLTCSTNAPKTSCAISTSDPLNSSVVDFTTSSSGSATVRVATTANSLLFRVPPSLKMWIWVAVGVGQMVLFLLTVRRRFAARHASSWKYGMAAFLIVAGSVIFGCGGGGTSAPPSVNTGTPPGSYTVTVNAYTVSGGGTTPDATVSIPLTVN